MKLRLLFIAIAIGVSSGLAQDNVKVLRVSNDYGELQYSMSRHRLDRLPEHSVRKVNEQGDVRIPLSVQKALFLANQEFTKMYVGWEIFDFHSIVLDELKFSDGSVLAYEIRFYTKELESKDLSVFSVYILMDGEPLRFSKISSKNVINTEEEIWPDALLLNPKN